MDQKHRTVVVAVDASAEGDQVLEAAVALHPRSAAGYYVVTVVPPLVSGISGMDGASYAASWPLKDMEAQITREITDAVRERVASFGIPPERAEVLVGRPSSEIKAFAESVAADLIVIGSHARGPVSRVLLGSTANNVLHAAPCDVLVVRVTPEGD